MNDLDIQKKALLDTLEVAREKDMLFLPNDGNAGDSLINSACYQIFDRLCFEYQEISDNQKDHQNVIGKTLILGGGGGLRPYYSHMSDRICTYAKLAKRLIIMPQTLFEPVQSLHKLNAESILFLRDPRSYETAKSMNLKAKVVLTCDAAFHFKSAELSSPRFSSLPAKRQLKLVLTDLLVTAKRALFGARLQALRIDPEATDEAIKSSNLDLSVLSAIGCENRSKNDLSTKHFLRQIQKFSTVRSNRLHVCIGGSLLGKKVSVLDNNYGKNAAIFSFSMNSFTNAYLKGEE